MNRLESGMHTMSRSLTIGKGQSQDLAKVIQALPALARVRRGRHHQGRCLAVARRQSVLRREVPRLRALPRA